MDKAIMIWKPEKESGIWLNESRVGKIGGQNTLGFFSAIFNSEGTTILGHSYNGALHMWVCVENEEGGEILDFIGKPPISPNSFHF